MAPAGHETKQDWTAPAFSSSASRSLNTCLAAARRSVQCPRRCPKVVPNLARAREGGWLGRAEVCRQGVRVSPRKPQNCPRPQKEWNQFKKPCSHVPPSLPRLPPLRPRSLLPALRPGPLAPARPLVETFLEAPSGWGNFSHINRAGLGFIILAPRQREVSTKLEGTVRTACLRPPGDTSAGDPGALRHKESACLSGRHAQLCGYADSVAACSNFVPSNMPT